MSGKVGQGHLVSQMKWLRDGYLSPPGPQPAGGGGARGIVADDRLDVSPSGKADGRTDLGQVGDKSMMDNGWTMAR